MHHALALLLLLLASPVWALTVGNTSQTEGTANTTVTLAHTVVAGDGRVLLVGISRADVVGSPTVTGVTYGGVAMTLVTNSRSSSGPGWDDAEWWYLDNPTVGGANVVVTVTAATQASMGVMARDYSGCGSSGCTITGNYNTNGTTGTSLSVASVSLENNWHALAAVTLAINGRTTSWTNATEDYDDDISTQSYSFATRNSTTTETPTITATFSANPIRSAMSIITVEAGDSVTFDALAYEPGDTATITATGFASAMTEVYLQNVGYSYDLTDGALNDLSSYFTRTGTATTTSSSSIRSSVATGVSAYDGANGLYLEDAATQLWYDSTGSAAYPGDGGFEGIVNGSSGSYVSSTYYPGENAWSITCPSASARYWVQDPQSATANTDYYFSVIVESNPDSLRVDQIINIASLPSGTETLYPSAATIPAAGDRIYSHAELGGTGGTIYPRMGCGVLAGVDGDVVISSPQFEANDLTSYIPSAASEPTRNATALDDIPTESATNNVALWAKVAPNFASGDDRTDNRIVLQGDASNLFDISFGTSSNVVSFRRRAGGSDTETASVTVTGGWDYQDVLTLAFRATATGIEARVKKDSTWYTASTSDGTTLSTAVDNLDVGNVGLVQDLHVWTGDGIPTDADLALFSMSGDYDGVITVESGASSTSADFIVPALTAYLPGGSHQQIPFGDTIYVDVTDGSTTLMDTYTNDQPANSTSSYYTSNVLCSTGSCPADSLAETSTPPLTNMVSGDDALCRATSGTFTTINDYLVSMYPGAVTIGCRYFDESLQAWSAESSKAQTLDSAVANCPSVTRQVTRQATYQATRSSICAPL